jgi:hypothetical protein
MKIIKLTYNDAIFWGNSVFSLLFLKEIIRFANLCEPDGKTAFQLSAGSQPVLSASKKTSRHNRYACCGIINNCIPVATSQYYE